MKNKRKETRGNLQCDWYGILDWYDIPELQHKYIIDAIIEEVDAWRNRSLWDRIINKFPEWELGKALDYLDK